MKSLRPYRNEWEKIESLRERPTRMRKLKVLDYEPFKENVFKADATFIKEFVDSFYSGDVYIIKNVFSKNLLKKVRNKVFTWGERTDQNFLRITENIPNFHRRIAPENSKKYSIQFTRHTYYLFPWNEDEFEIMDVALDRWSLMKYFGGFKIDEYMGNSAEDGIVDRIVIGRYPPGTGKLELHSDPYKFQRSIFFTKMSERGIDYEEGGLYFIDEKDKKIPVDHMADVGDVYLAYPTVLHGVDVVDPHKPLNWNTEQGRWILGFYSQQSDLVQNKHTGHGVNIKENTHSNQDQINPV